METIEPKLPRRGSLFHIPTEHRIARSLAVLAIEGNITTTGTGAMVITLPPHGAEDMSIVLEQATRQPLP